MGKKLQALLRPRTHGRCGGVLPALVALLIAFGLCPLARAADWPQWRGPHFNGTGDARDLPTTWSETLNLRWVVPLPGQSAATPAVVGDRVFLVSPDEKSDSILTMCLDLKTGEELWRRNATPARANPRNNAASASPVADAGRVYCIFATGDFVCYDHDGEELWRQNLESAFGPLSLQFLYSSSPLLFQDRLYVIVLRNLKEYHGEAFSLDSFLLCVDPKTGENLWRHVRETDAEGENPEAYTTAIPYDGGDRPRLFIMGGDYLTAHDPDAGLEVWRMAYNPEKRMLWRVIPSPVIAGDLVVASLPRGRTACFAAPADLTGNSTLADCAWLHEEHTPDVCTPLYYDGLLYVLDGARKRLACLEPASGALVWEHKFDCRAIFRASPTGADGHIYCLNMDGEAFVLRAGRTPDLVGRVAHGGENCMASIVAVDDCLLLRTDDRLWCVANDPPDSSAADNPSSNAAPVDDAPTTQPLNNTSTAEKEPS